MAGRKRGIFTGSEKAQSPVSLVSADSKRRMFRGLGFTFFLAGAFLIANSLFSLTGYAVSGSQFTKDGTSLLGLVLEIIGVSFMLIKFENKNNS